MKIRLTAGRDYAAEIDVGVMDVELVGVYNGVLIRCEQGDFGICQRDGGIEVLLNGNLMFASVADLEERSSRGEDS